MWREYSSSACAPYFLLIFVKPFEWWAGKAIGDWKGPDVGYLSAGAYFWAKADKLTRRGSKTFQVSHVPWLGIATSLFISSRLKDVSGNTMRILISPNLANKTQMISDGYGNHPSWRSSHLVDLLSNSNIWHVNFTHVTWSGYYPIKLC